MKHAELSWEKWSLKREKEMLLSWSLSWSNFKRNKESWDNPNQSNFWSKQEVQEKELKLSSCTSPMVLLLDCLSFFPTLPKWRVALSWIKLSSLLSSINKLLTTLKQISKQETSRRWKKLLGVWQRSQRLLLRTRSVKQRWRRSRRTTRRSNRISNLSPDSWSRELNSRHEILITCDLTR